MHDQLLVLAQPGTSFAQALSPGLVGIAFLILFAILLGITFLVGGENQTAVRAAEEEEEVEGGDQVSTSSGGSRH